MNEIVLGSEKYVSTPLKLREWIQLEEIKYKLDSAVDKRNLDEISSLIYSYLSTALSIQVEFSKIPWIDVAKAFDVSYETNLPNLDFPIISVRSEEKKNEIEFDYPGRTWFIWLHQLAGAYGWNVEYIAELEVNTAIGLLQEILANEQYSKEWQWGMSENAFRYDTATKQSKFVPLDKPIWMINNKPQEPAKKVKILKRLLPVGNIIRWDGNNAQS